MARVVFLFLLLVFALPTLLALVDIIRSNFKAQRKIMWLLIVVFCNGIGALLYFALGIRDKLPKASAEENATINAK